MAWLATAMALFFSAIPKIFGFSVIATALVNTLFMAVVGAVALALAFGLGGRETAAEIVRDWYQKGRQNGEKIALATYMAGDDIKAKSVPYKPS